MKQIEKSVEIAGRALKLSTGKLAGQADGAVLASYGDTVVLAAVVSAQPTIDLGYFPLTVEYAERLYAGGRIKGSRWVKREGRPTDDEILTARLIDRSIRPLFPKEYKKEVQVIITVLSVDLENSPEIISAVATSAALSISSIPWKGPIGVVRVGMKNREIMLNPKTVDLQTSELDLVVSSTKDAIIMIEAGAKEVPEDKMLAAIEASQKENEKIIELIAEFAKEAGKEKQALTDTSHDEKIKKEVKKVAGTKIIELVKKMAIREAGYADYNEIKSAAVSSFAPKETSHAGVVFEELFRELGREMVLKGARPDDRKNDEIRPLSAEVAVLPRTHGSGLFQRGETQVLTVTTLASMALEQLIETAEGEESKRYMHHYTMPPFATGETGKVGYPNRREIGHSALAERAILPVLPSKEAFPYAIRAVSEVLSSNGSTSMASVCGSTLSLMDAGVPLTSAVSGIAMGVIIGDDLPAQAGKKFVVLSDITGLEDGIGDMDFKVAGTKTGITALQLDVKTLNLTSAILGEALKQAKEGREKIMKVILSAIGEPRVKVSVFAPKIRMLKINTEKIGELIGPGGRNIRKIIADTGTQVEVDDDGSVSISGTDAASVEAAYQKVYAITKDVIPGEIYEGEVKRIQPFGVFVEILPGKDGMVHVSDMSEGFVNDPGDLVKIGDKVSVRVKEIDELGRINLSMILDPSKNKERVERRGGDRGGVHTANMGRGFGSRGGGFKRRFFDKSGSGSSWDRRPRPQGGPHFPTSRLVDGRSTRGGSAFGRKKGFAR